MIFALILKVTWEKYLERHPYNPKFSLYHCLWAHTSLQVWPTVSLNLVSVLLRLYKKCIKFLQDWSKLSAMFSIFGPHNFFYIFSHIISASMAHSFMKLDGCMLLRLYGKCLTFWPDQSKVIYATLGLKYSPNWDRLPIFCLICLIHLISLLCQRGTRGVKFVKIDQG